MNWFFARLNEGSSYAGFAALAHSWPQLLATKGADTQAVVTAVCGLAAFLKPENTSQTKAK